jgi:hypothetical protein
MFLRAISTQPIREQANLDESIVSVKLGGPSSPGGVYGTGEYVSSLINELPGKLILGNSEA